MELFIGIDQSINSTGLTLQVYSKGKLKFEHFYIITGKDKLSNKEIKAHNLYNNFEYVKYPKYDIKTAVDNHEAEIFKTLNLSRISDCILKIIELSLINYKCKTIYICMEGLSYQSSNTVSIMELAGLNYLIRYKLLLKYFNNKKYEFRLIVSPPGEIKKFASGNGAAKKEVMISLFEANFPNLYLIPKIDDIADSYWMCCYAHHLFNIKDK